MTCLSMDYYIGGDLLDFPVCGFTGNSGTSSVDGEKLGLGNSRGGSDGECAGSGQSRECEDAGELHDKGWCWGMYVKMEECRELIQVRKTVVFG